MSTDLPTPRETEPGPSLGTIVWGVIVVALASILGANRFGWFSVDPQVIAMTLLVVVGIGLVFGGALAALRGRRGRDDEHGA